MKTIGILSALKADHEINALCRLYAFLVLHWLFIRSTYGVLVLPYLGSH